MISAAMAQTDGDASTRQQLLSDQAMQNIQKMAAKMPPEWFACRRSDDDCGLVAYNCFAEELAANKAHLKDVQEVICKTELCAWLQCVRPAYSFYAACEAEQCVTKIKPFKPD